MEVSQLLLELAQPPGVSGWEALALEKMRTYLEPLGTCQVSPLGSLYCFVKEVPGKPHVMLNAHVDGIGMVVSYIDEKGFLRVGNCGGLDRSTVLAAQVIVHTPEGELPGVVCTIPPHLNPDDSKLPKMEELAIDVGLSGEAAKEKIPLGSRITMRSPGGCLLGGKVASPVLDDRAGCAAVILAAQKLAAQKLNCSLTVALTSMEEVGSQGAKTAAQALAPDMAFVVDVSFGQCPGVEPRKAGKLGAGPMLGIAPILDNALIHSLRQIAKECQIPYQEEVMGGSTGTDADAIASAGAGVRCAMLSIPQRYMHTPVEVVDAADVQATADLICAYLSEEFGEGE